MNFSASIKQLRAWFADLTVGGAWGRTLTSIQQHNLTRFWFDGFFASASDNIVVNFISVYIIVLGASETQVGLMSSFSSIVCAMVLLPAAFFAERVARKKNLAVTCGVGARLSILMLVFVPILFKGPAAIWVAILFSVLRDAFNNFGFPAWMSNTNEIVPIDGRGRYFGSRNFIMSITGMAATLLAGKVITLISVPLGYQIAMGAAFTLGMSSVFSYASVDDSGFCQRDPAQSGFKLRDLAAMVKGQPQFIAFTLTAALWNFAINVTGPFFNVQMVNVLHFSAATIGFLSVVTSFATMISQRKLGTIDDRIGSRKLQLIGMCLIPLLPLAWIFVTSSWQVVIINAFSGIFWGMFNLASFNLLLDLIPHDQVPRYSAIYQIVIMIALALGALVGSAIVSIWGFIGVLLTSVVLRCISAGLFSRFVREPAPGTPSLPE